jgi:signal transduction histidine kinase
MMTTFLGPERFTSNRRAHQNCSRRTMPDTRPDHEEFDGSSFVELLREYLVSGVIALDGQGRICSFNAEAERLTAVKASAALGQPVDVLPEVLRRSIQKCGQGMTSVTEVVLSTNDTTPISVQVQCFPCLGEAPLSTPLVVLLHELSSTRKLALSLQRLDRLASIGTLSASMAHEIKNALVSVNTFVEDLLERNKDSELSSLVSRELRRIDKIVSQMLKFAGPANPTFSKVSLHRILDQSLRLIQPQLEGKKIHLHRSLAARPDTLQGDDYQLEQVFLNLFLNAVTAMGPNGQLIVSTENAPPPSTSSEAGRPATDQWLGVTISDTGSGIPSENLGRLFEPFFTTKAHGTGLGLAITRRIVLEHHGKITVESELCKGTTFRLWFPVRLPVG